MAAGRRPFAARLLVGAGTAVFVAAVYAVVVLGVGALAHSPPNSVPLAVLATAIVAVTLEPIRNQLRRRLGRGAREILGDVAATLSGAVESDQIAPRMARLIAEATGAARVEVWLVPPEEDDDAAPEHPAGPLATERQAAGQAAGRPATEQQLAARWPEAAEPLRPGGPAVQTHEVWHEAELLGRIYRDPGTGGRLNPVEERLVQGVLGQAGVALRTVALSAELQRRVTESTRRAAELQASRQRIVAAADSARRRLERDIHDGAQQHLVALSINLSLAATVAGRDPNRAVQLIGDLRPAAAAALDTLAELSLGIYPPLLERDGLGVALGAAVRSSPVAVVISDRTRRRFGPATEAAAYFACLEAVQNALKHGAATAVQVELSEFDQALRFAVTDDGTGFDGGRPPSGSGLANMRDRVESLGGVLTVHSAPGAGTSVSASIPIRDTDG